MDFKFRGKTYGGDWVYGLLAQSFGKKGQPEPGYYISNSVGMPWAYNIIPSSKGLFTTEKDIFGIDIYQGDIATSDDIKPGEIVTGLIVWGDGGFRFSWREKGEAIRFSRNIHGPYSLKVIGNFTDTPELFK